MVIHAFLEHGLHSAVPAGLCRRPSCVRKAELRRAEHNLKRFPQWSVAACERTAAAFCQAPTAAALTGAQALRGAGEAARDPLPGVRAGDASPLGGVVRLGAEFSRPWRAACARGRQVVLACVKAAVTLGAVARKDEAVDCCWDLAVAGAAPFRSAVGTVQQGCCWPGPRSLPVAGLALSCFTVRSAGLTGNDGSSSLWRPACCLPWNASDPWQISEGPIKTAS